jgi:type IV secretion system protein VirD4
MPSARFFLVQAAASLLLALAAVWAATQWAAAMLGYQSALGLPIVSFDGIAIYAPWKLFPWWLAFEHQAPGIFDKAGLIAALGGIAPGLVAIGGAAWRARAKPTITTYGSARWADVSEIKTAGLFADRGVVLGLYGAQYLRHDGPEHVLAVAPTRSGKGVGLVVPTLLSWTGSTVVHASRARTGR